MTTGRHSPTRLATGGDNAIAVTLGILGDEWNLWILRHAMADARRYGDWMAHGSISNSVLSARLASLTESGLFVQEQYSERPVRFEYVLTPRGRAVWPILIAMWAWEQEWAPASAAPLPTMHHTACGLDFDPRLGCRSCGNPADAHDVVAAFGPSGDWSRSVPTSVGRRRSQTGVQPSELLPHTMELLGNRWSASFLGALFLGAHRFRDFAERTGASPAIVSDRLRRFVELGVVKTRSNAERPDWRTYQLTPKGLAFFPVVILMIAWGQDWFEAPEGPALVLTHTTCGGPFHPELLCGACGQPLTGASIGIR